jgi:hypothetical protein
MTDITFEEKLRIEDDAIVAARRVGAQAYTDSVASGKPAQCPYDPDASGDSLDDIRKTGWTDGFMFEQDHHVGATFEVLGTPTPVAVVREHVDGAVSYAIPAPKRAD